MSTETKPKSKTTPKAKVAPKKPVVASAKSKAVAAAPKKPSVVVKQPGEQLETYAGIREALRDKGVLLTVKFGNTDRKIPVAKKTIRNIVKAFQKEGKLKPSKPPTRTGKEIYFEVI